MTIGNRLCATRRWESSGGERTLPLVSRSWPMKLGGSLVRGTPGRAGAASDNVRDGLGLSDGPGPASSDGKAYVRNRCLKPRKSSAGSNLTDMGRCAVHGCLVSTGRPTPKPVGWSGGEATVKCLRRRRGDAVGVKVDASLIDRFVVNVGTTRGRPPDGYPTRRWAGPLPAEGCRVGRRPRSSPSARKARTWRRGASKSAAEVLEDQEVSPVNTDDLDYALFEAERRVLEIQTKLHRWADLAPGACGAPVAVKAARRVREAVRGNRPVERPGTAPRPDFTIICSIRR